MTTHFINLYKGLDPSWSIFMDDINTHFKLPNTTFIRWEHVGIFLKEKYNARYEQIYENSEYSNSRGVKILFETKEHKTEFILRYL